MLRHRAEIAIIVEQWSAVFDAPGSDQEVDCLADGNPATTQGPKITSRQNGDGVSRHGYNFKTAQEGFDLLGGPLAIEALQYLAKHQVADDDSFFAEGSLKRHNM